MNIENRQTLQDLIEKSESKKVNDRLPLGEWIELYNAGAFEDDSVSAMCEAGWYDWFCRNDELYERLEILAPLVKALASCPRISQRMDDTYVFFKNNCPCSGPLYDSFSICDIHTLDVRYAVCLRTEAAWPGAKVSYYEVWDFTESNVPDPEQRYANLHEFDTLREVESYFG